MDKKSINEGLCVLLLITSALLVFVFICIEYASREVLQVLSCLSFFSWLLACYIMFKIGYDGSKAAGFFVSFLLLALVFITFFFPRILYSIWFTALIILSVVNILLYLFDFTDW